MIAKPGDIVAFQTSGFFAWLIRFGAWIGRDKWWSRRYTHIGIVTGNTGNEPIITQAVKTINRVVLNTYGDTPCVVISRPEKQRVDCMLNFGSGYRYTYEMVGTKYGVLSVISRGLNYITPRRIRIDFTRDGRVDCSVFAARYLEHTGYVFDKSVDVGQITPSDFVSMFCSQHDALSPERADSIKFTL